MVSGTVYRIREKGDRDSAEFIAGETSHFLMAVLESLVIPSVVRNPYPGQFAWGRDASTPQQLR
jgi:hypothetical protein